MATDLGIMCFQHCSSKSIFCKNIPEVCPLCQNSISNYKIEPFRVPYPFKNAVDRPTSIILRPSKGTFLDNYDIGNDLHIGIVNSKAVIFEFDNRGLIINDLLNWTHCIAIEVIPPSWDYYWDELLENLMKDDKWKASNYHHVKLNCFNFVIEFLNNLNYPNLKFTNKEDLCNKFILSKVQDVVRYIRLHRNLVGRNIFVPY